MRPDSAINALTACGQACLRATNGHHRRWAVKRCTDALVATGTSPAIAQRCAQAMAAVMAPLASVPADAAQRGRP